MSEITAATTWRRKIGSKVSTRWVTTTGCPDCGFDRAVQNSSHEYIECDACRRWYLVTNLAF